jgi:hypothetical protein
LNDEWAKPTIVYSRVALNNVPKRQEKVNGTDVIGVIHRRGDPFDLEFIHILRY